MGNSTRTWQLISLMLAVALILVLIKLASTTPTTSPPVTGTSSTVDSATNPEQLALSPNSRRVHERYSL